MLVNQLSADEKPPISAGGPRGCLASIKAAKAGSSSTPNVNWLTRPAAHHHLRLAGSARFSPEASWDELPALTINVSLVCSGSFNKRRRRHCGPNNRFERAEAFSRRSAGGQPYGASIDPCRQPVIAGGYNNPAK